MHAMSSRVQPSRKERLFPVATRTASTPLDNRVRDWALAIDAIFFSERALHGDENAPTVHDAAAARAITRSSRTDFESRFACRLAKPCHNNEHRLMKRLVRSVRVAFFSRAFGDGRKSRHFRPLFFGQIVLDHCAASSASVLPVPQKTESLRLHAAHKSGRSRIARKRCLTLLRRSAITLGAMWISSVRVAAIAFSSRATKPAMLTAPRPKR